MTDQIASSAPRRGFTPAKAFDTADYPLLRGHLVARSKSELLLVKAHRFASCADHRWAAKSLVSSKVNSFSTRNRFMNTRATIGRRPSHASSSWTRRLARFSHRFPRLLRTEYWTRSRTGSLWTSLFGSPRRKPGGKSPSRRNRRIYRQSSDLRMESLEPRRLLTNFTHPHFTDPDLTFTQHVDSTTATSSPMGARRTGRVTLRSAVIASNANAVRTRSPYCEHHLHAEHRRQ